MAHINEQLQQHYTQEAALAANAGITVDTLGMTSEPEQLQDGSEGGLSRGGSLNRTGAAAGGGRFKKPGGHAGGLARTAHANQAASKRDSMGSEIGAAEGYPGYYGVGSAASSPVSARGVQLSDRPMDD